MTKLIFSTSVFLLLFSAASGSDLTSAQVDSLPLPPKFTATYRVDKTVGVPSDKAAEVQAKNELRFKETLSRGLMTKEQVTKILEYRNSFLKERPITHRYRVTISFSDNRFLLDVKGDGTREAIAFDGQKSTLIRMPNGGAAVFKGNLAYQMLAFPYFYGRLPGLINLRLGNSGKIESIVPGSVDGQAAAYEPAKVLVSKSASTLRIDSIELPGLSLQNSWLPTDSAEAPPSAYSLRKYVGYDSKGALVPNIVVEAHRESYTTTFDESELAPERLMTTKTAAQAGVGKDLVGFYYEPGKGDLAKQEAEYREYKKRGEKIEAQRKAKAGSSAAPLVLSLIGIVVIGGITFYGVSRRRKGSA